MSILIALLVGSFVGSLGGYLLRENIDTLVVYTVFGIAGSLLGTGIYFLLDTNTRSLVNLPSIVSSAIGAMSFVLVLGVLQKILPKRAASQTHVEESGVDED